MMDYAWSDFNHHPLGFGNQQKMNITNDNIFAFGQLIVDVLIRNVSPRYNRKQLKFRYINECLSFRDFIVIRNAMI